MANSAHDILKSIRKHLNFFRIHLLVFTFVPLILSGIFYAVNGEYKVSYIDSLYMCFSAFTETGLATINLSTLTPFQQVLLWLQMLFGGLVSVSWVMVFIRRQFFVKKFQLLVEQRRVRRKKVRSSSPLPVDTETEGVTTDGSPARDGSGRSAIRRLGGVPQRIDPSGRILDEMATHADERTSREEQTRLPHVFDHAMSPVADGAAMRRTASRMPDNDEVEGILQNGTGVPRTQTVGFREPTLPSTPISGRHPLARVGSHHPSIAPNMRDRLPRRSRDQGFGGFPLPHAIIGWILSKFSPGLHNRLTRTLTGTHSLDRVPTVRTAAYLTFQALVGRNSAFYGLTHEEEAELGGVEFRALDALLWIVGIYWLMMQLVCWMVLAVSATLHGGYDWVFDNQFRYVSPVWWALFFTTSAWSNNGLSLADEGQVQFQTAYAMSVALILVILGGNTAFPIFLRLVIWILSYLLPRNSRTVETLQFLLDHPRRCFTYLFPSRQTWLLVLVLIILNAIDWLSFEICDIGMPETDAIAVGTRIMDGLLQAISVRTAGFSVVNISGLAPAVQVMMTIMMYISAYPIAMTIRSTNVYEERSLGVFDDENEEEPSGPWENYLAWHIRKQLAFDIWWIFIALWLICIIERNNVLSTGAWFDVFPILFELVSAYGTVGLSLGIPNQNYSLSGAFTPLSKLVVILVMIRGRHRGLPVAIDRAVVLPFEFKWNDSSEQSMRSAAQKNGQATSNYSEKDIQPNGASVPQTADAQKP